MLLKDIFRNSRQVFEEPQIESERGEFFLRRWATVGADFYVEFFQMCVEILLKCCFAIEGTGKIRQVRLLAKVPPQPGKVHVALQIR